MQAEKGSSLNVASFDVGRWFLDRMGGEQTMILRSFRAGDEKSKLLVKMSDYYDACKTEQTKA